MQLLISTCPPIRMEHHGSRFAYFPEIVYSVEGVFLKVEKISVCVTLDKNSTLCMKLSVSIESNR